MQMSSPWSILETPFLCHVDTCTTGDDGASLCPLTIVCTCTGAGELTSLFPSCSPSNNSAYRLCGCAAWAKFHHTWHSLIDTSSKIACNAATLGIADPSGYDHPTLLQRSKPSNMSICPCTLQQTICSGRSTLGFDATLWWTNCWLWGHFTPNVAPYAVTPSPTLTTHCHPRFDGDRWYTVAWSHPLWSGLLFPMRLSGVRGINLCRPPALHVRPLNLSLTLIMSFKQLHVIRNTSQVASPVGQTSRLAALKSTVAARPWECSAKAHVAAHIR